MIFQNEPKDFGSKFEVSSCFVVWDGKILLLQRALHKPQGGTWGVPAGKCETNETPLESITRELREETGIETVNKSPEFFQTIFVKYPDYDFKYHMYSIVLNDKPEIKIDFLSHTSYEWRTPSEALKLNLIEDEDHCIKLFFKLS